MATKPKKFVYVIAPDGTEFERTLSAKHYPYAVLARYEGDSFFSDGWREVGLHVTKERAQERAAQVSKYPNVAEVTIADTLY